MNTEQQTKIVEVNGVKLEVDLRNAKIITNYKVGDTVKILIKDYQTYKSYIGIIIGFDDFKNLPTIIVAYLTSGYDSADIKTAYYNSATEDVELTMASEHELNYDFKSCEELLQKDISDKQRAFEDAKGKLHYFKKYFERRFNSFIDQQQEKSV